MCADHYAVWYNAVGKPQGLVRKYAPRNETPSAKLVRNSIPDPETGCWNKIGRVNKGGYGEIWLNGKFEYMHRVSYELYVGPIPEGHWIDHLCRNPRCCNPEHLEAVLPAINFNRGARWNPELESQTASIERGN